MSFGLRILDAAARLFGPPSKRAQKPVDKNVGDAGVAAALIALGAKLAKADGVVSRAEIDAFKNVFQATTESTKGVAQFFNLAQQTTRGYESYARIVYRKYKSRPDILEDVVDGLFHIALADGIVTKEEMNFLETTGRIFGFKERTFNRIRIAHMGRTADDPYLILGVDEDISEADLKKIYRRMAAANHPDRVVARGLPSELRALATHKMAIINMAYAEILSQRKSEPIELAGDNN